MATIINPITTVLLNRTELDSGEFDRFPFKYILETDGTITYFSKLSAGRYVQSSEAVIPGLGVDRKVKAPEATFQSLAHGFKIPGEFFHQIKQFFKDVINLGPSTYEAQVFIIWNEDSKDYRILVPKQTVSAAAVRYDIGDTLGKGDVIICDIHSHNDMGAFFSGTDDRDDKKNPWISGVFGKISTSMENKFRFNDGCGRHFEMVAEDVFDFEDARFQTPQEWLDQVEISSASSSKVTSWARAYQYAGYESPGEDDHIIRDYPMYGGVDDYGSSALDWFLGEEAHSEDDLYDSFIEALGDIDEPNRVKKILTAVSEFLEDPKTSQMVDLDDESILAYMEITHTCSETKDHNLCTSVLRQLCSIY